MTTVGTADHGGESAAQGVARHQVVDAYLGGDWGCNCGAGHAAMIASPCRESIQSWVGAQFDTEDWRYGWSSGACCSALVASPCSSGCLLLSWVKSSHKATVKQPGAQTFAAIAMLLWG